MQLIQILTDNIEVGQRFELAGVHYKVTEIQPDSDSVVITAVPAAGVISFKVWIALPLGLGFQLVQPNPYTGGAPSA